jgi:hypothetical protein
MIPYNKPDIVIHDNEKGKCLLIETENILKYNMRDN